MNQINVERRTQPIKSKYFRRLTKQEWVMFAFGKRNIKKNAFCFEPIIVINDTD